MFVALGIQHAVRMRNFICGLPRSAVFFPHFLINGTIFEKRKEVTKNRMCDTIFCTTFV
jgi:hypothetical protein